MATLSKALASSVTMKLLGPVEVWRNAPNRACVSQKEGNTSAKATSDADGMKRIQATDALVSAKLANRQRSKILIEKLLSSRQGYYLRAKRSKSAIWRSISSRAASAAERMPCVRSWNSSGFEERKRASSRVISCLV